MNDCYLHCFTPQGQKRPDIPRFLITLDVGIGDAVAVGLRAAEQIIEHDPRALGSIDVLCNKCQAQVFACDPRFNRIIATNALFFPGRHIKQWLRGIILDAGAAQAVRFLAQRHYEAIFPSIVAPGLYCRLHAPVMYPRLLEMGGNLLFLPRRLTLRQCDLVKGMVDHYFRKDGLALPGEEQISLYITSKHVKKAIERIEAMKNAARFSCRKCEVLLVAPDTASVATRPPVDLLMQTLVSVLEARAHLLVAILPAYTETACARFLWETLSRDYPTRVFLVPSEPRMHLLELAAFIDQADIFIAGDTGVMHLAVTHKTVAREDDGRFMPRNAGKIITLFGGTSPGYFGYLKTATIVGWGRKEQRALSPGLFKGAYRPDGRNLFDHISPQQIVEVILT